MAGGLAGWRAPIGRFWPGGWVARAHRPILAGMAGGRAPISRFWPGVWLGGARPLADCGRGASWVARAHRPILAGTLALWWLKFGPPGYKGRGEARARARTGLGTRLGVWAAKAKAGPEARVGLGTGARAHYCPLAREGSTIPLSLSPGHHTNKQLLGCPLGRQRGLPPAPPTSALPYLGPRLWTLFSTPQITASAAGPSASPDGHPCAPSGGGGGIAFPRHRKGGGGKMKTPVLIPPSHYRGACQVGSCLEPWSTLFELHCSMLRPEVWRFEPMNGATNHTQPRLYKNPQFSVHQCPIPPPHQISLLAEDLVWQGQ